MEPLDLEWVLAAVCLNTIVLNPGFVNKPQTFGSRVNERVGLDRAARLGDSDRQDKRAGAVVRTERPDRSRGGAVKAGGALGQSLSVTNDRLTPFVDRAESVGDGERVFRNGRAAWGRG